MAANNMKSKYGITMAPIPCTEAWQRDMPFDHNNIGVITYSFILVNRYTGTRTHVNTYNGNAGSGYNAIDSTHKIKKWGEDEKAAEKDLARSLKTGKDNAYFRCKISDCPVAELAAPPEGWDQMPIEEPPLV